MMENNDFLKVAIVGSRKYTNKKKIQEYIFRLKKQFGDKVQIVSGGCKTGTDLYAKEIALDFDMKYGEFPPAHEQYNTYCISENIRTVYPDFGKPKYGRRYNVGNYFKRNKEIAEYCDVLLAFIPKGIKSNGTNNTIKHMKKLKKKVIIFD